MVEIPPDEQTLPAAKLTDAGKEQVKLQGAYVNGLAIGCFVAGVLTPTLAIAINPASGGFSGPALLAMLVCFGLSLGLHSFALRVLKEMDR